MFVGQNIDIISVEDFFHNIIALLSGFNSGLLRRFAPRNDSQNLRVPISLILRPINQRRIISRCSWGFTFLSPQLPILINFIPLPETLDRWCIIVIEQFFYPTRSLTNSYSVAMILLVRSWIVSICSSSYRNHAPRIVFNCFRGLCVLKLFLRKEAVIETLPPLDSFFIRFSKRIVVIHLLPLITRDRGESPLHHKQNCSKKFV
jgi:hypothetical protein